MICKFYSVFLTLILILNSVTALEFQYDIKTFDMLIDHFSFVETRTFPLRYLINDSYVEKRDSPILIYAGNEADIEKFPQNTGFMWRAAKELKALIIFAEHRYYGESLPFGDESFENLKYLGYLNTQQAMADFAELLNFLNPRSKRPVIAMGGSYGGRLAAWMRLKYPHILIGSLASSAPLRNSPGLSPSCDLYNRIITYVFRNSMEDKNNRCVENLEKVWSTLK